MSGVRAWECEVKGSRMIRKSDVVLSWVPRNVSGAEEGFEGVVEAVEAYGITTWGWGEEPSGGLPVNLFDQMRASGVEKIAACACWNILPPAETEIGHLLRSDPTYADARVVDMNGAPIPLPFWLVEEGNWMCSNHPGYRDVLKRKVALIIEAGADTLQFDNHLTGSWQPLAAVYWPTSEVALMAAFGGCFCGHCVAGFREYLRARYSVDKLESHGILEIESFDYREVVRSVAPSRREFIAAYDEGRIPLIESYHEFHLQACVTLNAELKASAERLAGRQVPLSANASSLFPCELAAAHLLDQFVAEVSFCGQPGNLAVLPFKIAEALGKPIASTFSGESCAHVAKGRRFNTLKQWIAAGYAMGGNPTVPFRMWTHTDEDGLHWLDLPEEEIVPLYRFVRHYPELFDGYRSIDQVKVLYSNAAARKRLEDLTSPEGRGNGGSISRSRGEDGEPVTQSPNLTTTVHRACWSLLARHVPFGMVLAGDDWFRHQLDAGELAAADVVVVPAPAELDETQAATLAANAAGKLLSWTDDRDTEAVIRQITPLTTVESKSPVWVLPREHAADPESPIVIHLVNAAIDHENDVSTVQRNVVLRLSRRLIGFREKVDVEWLSPESAPRKLLCEWGPESFQVTVPELNCWGVVRLKASESPAIVGQSNLS